MPVSRTLNGLFARSRLPMAILDDGRRIVELNGPACAMLRGTREELLGLRIDGLTPPESERRIDQIWDELTTEGAHGGPFELLLAEGTRVAIEYSATGNVEPGRHLSIFYPRESGSDATDFGNGAEAALHGAQITSRERDVLGLLATGATHAEIATSLLISPETVRTHVANARAKLGARNRQHAVAIALKQGLIDL